ncbi:hypothetical protein, partial [Caballeronia sp. BR00000012568055]|uniref:hypothetical protein n=1 Tax=Caballeronia sp. BR00000012568055 TaxID=2918761 RepID=UPI0023FA3A82
SDVLASISQRLGFIGRANFDAIVTDCREIVFTEVNGRSGGCSHFDVILRALVGPDYLSTHTVVTRNRVPVCDLGRALDASRSLRGRGNESGVVVLTEDILGTGTIEYMVYARNPADALALENEFHCGIATAKEPAALPR